MKIGVWITIIGEVQKLGDSIIILGKGYQVEIEPMVELNHWLQVLVNNQTRMNDKKQPLSSSDYSAAQGMKRQKRSGSSLFVSLSSQPSPIRGSTEDLYPSPIRVDENDQISCSQITREAPWHWSPDHIAATSTPLMQSLFGSPYHIRPLTSGRSSPLCNTETAIITQQHNNNDDDDDDDDDFGFADDSQFEAMDFDDLEKKALENRAL
ncbi:hypothetical protein BC941DRAFT_455043 [Chlamydoabsidia padenii]|nr:hypothetical protein BC941DRAFT_455043 [Chlamydoabsidia padenii]